MTDVAFPDPDEILGGRPGKRADVLLLLIESRTAELVSKSRRAMQPVAAAAPPRPRDLEYFEAFAAASEARPKPTVQQLERHAQAWSTLVPPNPKLKAALAQRLGRRYALTPSAVAGIRSAVGLDDPAVRKAYVTLYSEPLETIYVGRIGVRQRLHWSWSSLAARLENLPPFWSVYAMALTETVGATILALPIALASVGPLPGVAVLVALGLVNIATVAYMAESVARSGPMRHGNAYIGRVVGDFLGQAGSLVLSVALFSLCLLILPVFYIGVATTLADATGVSAPVWVLGLFAVNIFFLGRDIGATMASALLVGAVNIGLILALCVVAFANLDSTNLTYVNVPFVDGRPFEVGLFGLVFGVVLAAYFGHTSAVLCGRLVLRRDPTGRALVRGCVAAQATAMVLYCMFVVAVNGAVDPRLLAAETGTALSPLAQRAGPAVLVIGGLFVILGMGMVSVHFALALFNVVRERLPAEVDLTVWAPRRAGAIVFRGRSWRNEELALTYLGMAEGALRFRLEVTASGRRESEDVMVGSGRIGADDIVRPALLDRGPRPRRFGFYVLSADGSGARLRIITTMRLVDEFLWRPPALDPATITALSDDEGALLGWIMRHGPVDVGAAARQTGRDESTLAAQLETLAAAEILTIMTTPGGTRYAAAGGTRRPRRLPEEVWTAFDDASRPARDRSTPPGGQRRGLGRRARFLIAVSPVAAAFLGTEWMLLSGTGSFAGLLAFAGVVVVTLLAGTFPVLLVVASRRKGSTVPSSTAGFLARPVVLACVYVIFLLSVLLHGLVIWEGVLLRTGALLVSAGIIALTVLMWRRGTFTHRLTIEVVDDDRDGGRRRFRIERAGRPLSAAVVLEYPDGPRPQQTAEGVVPVPDTLQRLCVTVPHGLVGVGEVKIWAHRLNASGDSSGLPAAVDLVAPNSHRHVELGLAHGDVIFSLPDEPATVCVDFHAA